MAALYLSMGLGMLAAGGVFVAVWSLTPAPPSNADVVEGRLREYMQGAPQSLAEIDLQRPFRERVVVPTFNRIGRWLEQRMPEKARIQIMLRLQLAGRPGGMSATDFIATRYVLAGLLCIVGTLIGVLTHNNVLVALGAAVGAVVGLYGPMLWLSQKVKGRQLDIRSDLPDVIDVLIVCVEAGLTFEAAMEKVVEKYDHALAGEFGRVLQETRLGRPRLEALADMGQRNGVEELNSFCQAIIQSEQIGAGIARILGIQSDEIRLKRLISAEERGAKASLKMLIPMVGCIFPTLWIILLGPAALLVLRLFRAGL